MIDFNTLLVGGLIVCVLAGVLASVIGGRGE